MGSPFLGRREPGLADPEPSLNKPQARALSEARTAAMLKVVSGLRHRAVNVRDSLVGVELNPGPAREGARRGRRGVGIQRRRDRTQRRYERRKERKRAGNGRQRMRNRRLEKEHKIVTWNVQKLSLRDENRRRLRRVCEKIKKGGMGDSVTDGVDGGRRRGYTVRRGRE